MPKTIAVLGSALFFVVAPLVLAGFIPWWTTHWEFRPAFFGFEVTRAIGLMLIIAGVPGVVDSFARFALQGLGTPAPIAPTQKLVVTGLYRYVRNPIYVGVAAVIFGQALLFGDQRLLWYASTSGSWSSKNQRSRRHLARSTRISGPRRSDRAGGAAPIRGQATLPEDMLRRELALAAKPSPLGTV
ncbi:MULTISPECIES: methyltransferase family protein [Bradyrhizobium]|uniref:methyltransferase family protein n=1 Tax=Bradyrhizobium elkanii TaxID=29448 RepID=UPI001FDA3761|nr:methyltransferase [Bradyrhizobium elkanii]